MKVFLKENNSKLVETCAGQLLLILNLPQCLQACFNTYFLMSSRVGLSWVAVLMCERGGIEPRVGFVMLGGSYNICRSNNVRIKTEELLPGVDKQLP